MNISQRLFRKELIMFEDIMERMKKLDDVRRYVDDTKEDNSLYNQKRTKEAYKNTISHRWWLFMEQLGEFMREEK